MRHRRVPAPEVSGLTPEQEAAANAIAAWSQPKSERKPFAGATRTHVERTADEMQEMLTEGEWGDAEGRHLVALYAWCHREVYGVEAAEVAVGKEYSGAAMSAKRLIDTEFAGDVVTAVLYVRWVWERERGRHAWRQANGKEITRLSWRWLFVSKGLLTDYRAAMVGAKGGAK